MSKEKTEIFALPPLDVEEEDSYEDPFATFGWRRWQEMQAQTLQRFTRFQRAIERKQPRLAAMIVFEMQQMALEWQREAAEWVK